MKHNFLLIYSYLIRILFSFLPDVPKIMAIRGYFYAIGMKHCGSDFQVSSTAVLRGLENITCGSNVYLAPNSYIIARVGVEIEDEVLLAMNVVVTDGNHGYKDGSYRYAIAAAKPVYIKRGSWIAANSVVTAGSKINKGTLVGPCSVVRGELDADSIYLTSPISLLKKK